MDRIFFFLYRKATVLLLPFIVAYLYKRRQAGKEHPLRFRERLGRPSQSRPAGKLLWIHAASVGESISVLPLLNLLMERAPEWNVLFTTGTVTSAALLENKLPPRVIHQFIPVDSAPLVCRFLKHWQPDMALWLESEFWPNLLQQTAQRCPIILVNARISNSSFRKWQRYKPLARLLLSFFTRILPQDEESGSRLQALGAQRLHYLGNLKYDAPALPAPELAFAELKQNIGNRRLWVAASTHPGEEAMCAGVHVALKTDYPDLLTIIVPRHPQRGAEIVEQLTGKLRISQRSSGELPTLNTDIYIADTMGELGVFYRLAPIAFIGGSLVRHGGQNPLEAARLGCATLFGPYMTNFTDIARILQERDGALQVRDQHDLAKTMDVLLGQPERLAAMGQAGLEVAKARNGIAEKVAAVVLETLRY